MDFIYTTLRDLLNNLLPAPQQSTFGNLNDVLAYILTCLLLWTVFVRPLLWLFGMKNKK